MSDRASTFRAIVPKPNRGVVIAGLRAGMPLPFALMLPALMTAVAEIAWDDDGGNAVWAAIRFGADGRGA